MIAGESVRATSRVPALARQTAHAYDHGQAASQCWLRGDIGREHERELPAGLERPLGAAQHDGADGAVEGGAAGVRGSQQGGRQRGEHVAPQLVAQAGLGGGHAQRSWREGEATGATRGGECG